MRMGDAELKIMDALWRLGEVPAKRLADLLAEQVGWNKNTTYTLIRRLIEKGAVARSEPGFLCRALLMREQVRREQAAEMVDKLFDGSASLLLASLVDGQALPQGEIDALRALIDGMK